MCRLCGCVVGLAMGLSRGWGSAGSVLRLQGSSREHGLSRCARGMSVIASNARSGPIPLPPVRAWWVAICRSFGIGRLGLRFVDGWRFLGAGCVAGLAMVAGSRVRLRGIGPALAGKLAGAWAFALRARDECDRFQCSLRPDPAAAWNQWWHHPGCPSRLRCAALIDRQANGWQRLLLPGWP